MIAFADLDLSTSLLKKCIREAMEDPGERDMPGCERAVETLLRPASKVPTTLKGDLHGEPAPVFWGH
jgi:hypothetical protein